MKLVLLLTKNGLNSLEPPVATALLGAGSGSDKRHAKGRLHLSGRVPPTPDASASEVFSYTDLWEHSRSLTGIDAETLTWRGDLLALASGLDGCRPAETLFVELRELHPLTAHQISMHEGGCVVLTHLDSLGVAEASLLAQGRVDAGQSPSEALLSTIEWRTYGDHADRLYLPGRHCGEDDRPSQISS